MSKPTTGGLSIIKVIGVYIILQSIIVTLYILSCNYNGIKLDNNDVHLYVIRPASVERHYSRRGPDIIWINDGSDNFKLYWQGDYARKYGMNSIQISELLSKEQELSILLKRKHTTNEIVAIQGCKRTYLTIADYNDFHKKNSITGLIILSIFEVMLLLIFIPIFILLIRLRRE